MQRDSMKASIVEALDDLGERDKLAEPWLDDSDESPYPPEAIRQRSRRLRWRIQWRRRTVTAFMLIIAVTGGIGIADWSIPGALSGFLFGASTAFVVASIFTDPWQDQQVRALQLYDLLKQIENRSESATPTPSGD